MTKLGQGVRSKGTLPYRTLDRVSSGMTFMPVIWYTIITVLNTGIAGKSFILLLIPDFIPVLTKHKFA